MSQTLNFSIAGLWTSVSDYKGPPPGAMDIADNVESRYENTMEPRRGFDTLDDSELENDPFVRITEFYYEGELSPIALDTEQDLIAFDGVDWNVLPGNVSQGITFPDDVFAKPRFIKAGQNLYATTGDGVRSYSSEVGANLIRAGVPRGLNLEAEPDNTTGFFDPNIEVVTTGDITMGSALLTNIDDTTGIEIGMYVAGEASDATLVVQDLTYTALIPGVLGNAITITYVDGAALSVAVVSYAITVTLETGVSDADDVLAAIEASTEASRLVSVAVSGAGGNVQVAAAAANLAGGTDDIPIGTTVSDITPEAVLIIQTGNTTAGSTNVTNLASNAGIVAGVLITGDGIPDGTTVTAIAGAGPYNVTLSQAAVRTATGVELTFSAPAVITMSANAAVTNAGGALTFYYGAQVGYRVVYGRTETDIDGNKTVRLGAPTSIAIATNTLPYATNNVITATLPKNAENEIQFMQVYRSPQTAQAAISPLDQYNLVKEYTLTNDDFTARVVTLTDELSEALVGIPLYCGSDREGINQANNPPPMAWDMVPFRDFCILGNITQPTTLSFTIVAIGGTNGLQAGDTITIDFDAAGVQTYTAANAEDAANREFEVVTSGTLSQNITDTAQSLIRVINYDEALQVHAIYISTQTDLPGQILLEADFPSIGTFVVNANAHKSAYDPPLDQLDSDLNNYPNLVAISKSGELEAYPIANTQPVGNTTSDVVRLVALRDFVVIIKSDGIYKGQGLSPSAFTISPLDLTTKIIGPDTAVALNSAAWMYSNQGVVTVTDSGVENKSLPIDDQLNELLGAYKSKIITNSFAIGYESDRKYILSMPTSAETTGTEIQYNFNYTTNIWTTWSRNLACASVFENEDLLYIGRSDATDTSISFERKSYDYTDFVDEPVPTTIIAVDENEVELATVENVSVGDVLWQTAELFSPIIDVDLINNIVTTQYEQAFIAGGAEILKAFDCTIRWKPQVGKNPATTHQFGEGLALFKNTRFNVAQFGFITNFSQAEEEVEVTGTGIGLWGLFPWGDIPWGGVAYPQKIRFYVPADKQLCSYIIPTFRVSQGYSDFKLEGLSLLYNQVSPEVGR